MLQYNSTAAKRRIRDHPELRTDLPSSFLMMIAVVLCLSVLSGASSTPAPDQQTHAVVSKQNQSSETPPQLSRLPKCLCWGDDGGAL